MPSLARLPPFACLGVQIHRGQGGGYHFNICLRLLNFGQSSFTDHSDGYFHSSPFDMFCHETLAVFVSLHTLSSFPAPEGLVSTPTAGTF